MFDNVKMQEGDSLRTERVAVANRLLGTVPSADVARLYPLMRAQTFAAGEVLFQPGDRVDEVIFPTQGAILSLLSVLPDRKPVETVAIGCEGAVGALLGVEHGPAFTRCQMLTAGTVLRVPAESFATALDASPALRASVGRYVSALLAQLQGAVAAAAMHPVEARASGWMLALQDRLGDRALPITQEALADLLGVRRTTITRVVATLEERGLIRHRRSRLIVMDRAGLEAASGDCYRSVREQFERIAPGLYPPFADAA